MTKEKPDCNKCEYRGSVPGSAHSSCKHPSFKEIHNDPIMNVISILGGARGGLPPVKTGLNVKGNPHGVRGGWFNHPFNFDPVWLEECDGYKPKAVTS